MNLIKVSSDFRSASVAGAIAGTIREHHLAEIQAIGAGSSIKPLKLWYWQKDI